MEPKTESPATFQPKIVAFVCNWCTYTGADLAGTSRLQMAPNVRVIRLPCTGRIDPLFIVKALERGADGVIVSGCHPADCHYIAGNYHARRRFAVFRELLDFMGVDTRRFTFSWVSASEGGKWRDVVDETTERVRALGPYQEYQSLAAAADQSAFMDSMSDLEFESMLESGPPHPGHGANLSSISANPKPAGHGTPVVERSVR